MAMNLKTVDELRAEVEANRAPGAVRGRQMYGSFLQVDAAGLTTYQLSDSEALYVQFLNIDQATLDVTLDTPSGERDLFISNYTPISNNELRVEGWLISPGQTAHFAYNGKNWTWRRVEHSNSIDMAVGLFRRHETQFAGDDDITIGPDSPWETRTNFQAVQNVWTIEPPITVVDNDPTSPTFSRRYIGDSLLLTNDSWETVLLDLTATGQADKILYSGQQCILAAQADGTWEMLHASPLIRRDMLAAGAVTAIQHHISWDIYYFSDHTPTDTDGDGRPRYTLDSNTIAGIVQLDDNDTEDVSIILTQPDIEGGRDLWLTNVGSYSIFVYTSSNLIAPIAEILPDQAIVMDKYPRLGQWVWLTRRWLLDGPSTTGQLYTGMDTLRAADFSSPPPTGYGGAGGYTDSTWYYYSSDANTGNQTHIEVVDSLVTLDGGASETAAVISLRGNDADPGSMPPKLPEGSTVRVYKRNSTDRIVVVYGLDASGTGYRRLDRPDEWARFVIRAAGTWVFLDSGRLQRRDRFDNLTDGGTTWPYQVDPALEIFDEDAYADRYFEVSGADLTADRTIQLNKDNVRYASRRISVTRKVGGNFDLIVAGFDNDGLGVARLENSGDSVVAVYRNNPPSSYEKVHEINQAGTLGGLGNFATRDFGETVTISATNNGTDLSGNPGYQAAGANGTAEHIQVINALYGDYAFVNFDTNNEPTVPVDLVVPVDGMLAGNEISFINRYTNSPTMVVRIWRQNPTSYVPGQIPPFNGIQDANWLNRTLLEKPNSSSTGFLEIRADKDASTSSYWSLKTESQDQPVALDAGTFVPNAIDLGTGYMKAFYDDYTMAGNITLTVLAGAIAGSEAVVRLNNNDAYTVECDGTTVEWWNGGSGPITAWPGLQMLALQENKALGKTIAVLTDDITGDGGGAVSSVFSRTGNVVAQSSDYDASQIDNDSGVTGATVAAALDQLNAFKAPIDNALFTGNTTVGNLLCYAGVFGTRANLSSSAGVVTVDVGTGTYFTLTLSEDVTSFTFSSLQVTGYVNAFVLQVVQDTTARSITWNFDGVAVKWPGGLPPSLSAGAGAIDRFYFTSSDNGTTWLGDTVGQSYS